MLSYCITNLEGKILDEFKSHQELMPASNIKLFSGAAALEEFDPLTSPTPPARLIRVSDTEFMLDLQGSLLFSFRDKNSHFAEEAFNTLSEILNSNKANKLSLYCPEQLYRPLKHYPCVSFLSYNENTLDVTCENRLCQFISGDII